jgi:hypothetical protein
VVRGVAHEPDEMVIVGRLQLVLNDRSPMLGGLRKDICVTSVAVRLILDQFQINAYRMAPKVQVLGQPGRKVRRLI